MVRRRRDNSHPALPGSSLGTMPSLTADLFGSRSMGGIYGRILLAWGCGAVPSPMLIAYVREHSAPQFARLRRGATARL